MTLKTFRDTTINVQRPRREETVIDIIIIHAMSEYIVTEGRTVFAMDFLNEIQLGCHFFIAPDGMVIKGVRPEFRTPHVGKSEYMGRKWLNETSIGIEFLVHGINSYAKFKGIMRGSVGGTEPFTDEQYEAGGELIARLNHDYPKTVSRVTAHSVVSDDNIRGVGRGKLDPGAFFNWEVLTSATETHTFQEENS